MAEFPVFTHAGDVVDEVNAAVARLAAVHGSKEEAGLHRILFVSRARMTLVMVTHAHSPLACALRSSEGWTEPAQS